MMIHYFVLPVNRQETVNDFRWRRATTTNTTPTYNSTGVILPPTDDNSDILGRGGTVAELISTIHSSLDSKLSNVLTQLSGIENRMISLETRQTTLEQEVRHSSTSFSSPSGSDSSSSIKRRRVTPVELQVTGLCMQKLLCVFYFVML